MTDINENSAVRAASLAKFGGYQPESISLRATDGNCDAECIFDPLRNGWYVREFHRGRTDMRESRGVYANEVDAQQALTGRKIDWTDWH